MSLGFNRRNINNNDAVNELENVDSENCKFKKNFGMFMICSDVSVQNHEDMIKW